VSTIYVVERVYCSFEIQIKAFRVEAEANGYIEKLEQDHPERTFRTRQMELVED
jgi:hypothetical protein